MKKFDICGMGNALVDALTDITDEELTNFGFEKSSMVLVEPNEQAELFQSLGDRDFKLISGGSVANSIIAMAEIGSSACFLGCVGDDDHGMHYQSEMNSQGVDFVNPPLMGKTTGTAVTLNTPDAERTFRVSLGVAADLAPEHLNEEALAVSKWLFIEGYLLANGEASQEAVFKALEIAKKNDVKVAFTMSDKFVVDVFRDPLEKVVSQSDLVFSNEDESAAYTGKEDVNQALTELREIVPNLCITAGPKGAIGVWNEQEFQADAFECVPRDLNGAGDMFAGSFLAAVFQGHPPQKAARMANYMAREVITRIGARLHTGISDYWNEAAQQS